MKVRITCPSCGKGYVLDDNAVGEEFVCPACMTHLRVKAPLSAASASRGGPSGTAADRAATGADEMIVIFQ